MNRHKEILLVIIVLGTLVAVGIPFVLQRREGGRSNICKNNMAQLALAMRGFETNVQRFPGYSNQVGDSIVPWGVAILPQIDRPDLYDIWVSSTGDDMPYLVIFRCPNNPPERKGYPVTDMVYNAGYHGTAADKETSAHGVGHNYAESGVSCNVEQMVDGAATVLLISENNAATSWADTTNLKQNTVFCWYDSGQPIDHQINGNYREPINADRVRPASFHAGGVNAAFADRHTQFLSQDIDYTVYQHLMTPDSAKAGIAGKLDEGEYQ